MSKFSEEEIRQRWGTIQQWSIEIQQFFQEIYQRPPTLRESSILVRYLQKINMGSAVVLELAVYEAGGKIDLEHLYQVYLGRSVDPVGELIWHTELYLGRRTKEEIEKALKDSLEAQRRKHMSNNSWVPYIPGVTTWTTGPTYITSPVQLDLYGNPQTPIE